MVGISINKRYVIRAILGEGGMGVVYHAFDSVMRRDVALKTLRDVPSGSFLDLFSRECSVLAAMVHPNVVEIFDMGEFDDAGVSKPYFVMPLLPGCTLHDLIYTTDGAAPIATSRCVDIIAQSCRGLQAAHERKLVHQDIKPRNIFVMRDDAVKIIDFGVAHLGGGNSTGVRGTLKYMSPEQLTFKGVTGSSDIFSLAVVCYEALTASHPFQRRPDRRDTEGEIAEAITTYIPPLASEVNSSINRSVAQVVAKGMAKDIWNRFESAAVFAEALQKALRNENPGANRAIVQARLERARKSFAQNDLQFASEIVTQLEAEGHSDPDIAELRKSLNSAVRRERSESLLAAAERCFAGEEYSLALRKAQEVLEFDSTNAVALALRKRIDDVFAEQKLTDLLRIASERLQNSAFSDARLVAQDALKLRPSDTRARQLLDEVDSRQKESLRQRQEKERLYQAAQAAFFAGKIEVALETLDQLTKLNALSIDTRDRTDDYKELYRRVRLEHDNLKIALAQAQNLLDHDLSAAQKICDRYLAKYADQPDFRALAEDIKKRREEVAQAFRNSVATRVQAEDDPEIQLQILAEARKSQPKDEFLDSEFERVRALSVKLRDIAGKARALEQKRDLTGAIREWENLRATYARYPPLAGELSRLQEALQLQRAQRKLAILKEIEDALDSGAHDQSLQLLKSAENEYPADDQLAVLRFRAETHLQKIREVDSIVARARQANKRKRFGDIARAIAEAGEMASDVPTLRRTVFEEALAQADSIVAKDWRTAKKILEIGVFTAPELSVPPQYWENIRALEQKENVQAALNQAIDAETSGDLVSAQNVLEEALGHYPHEPQLVSKLASVQGVISEKRRREERARALIDLRALQGDLPRSESLDSLRAVMRRSETIAEPYSQQGEFTSILGEIGAHVSACESAAESLSEGNLSRALQICNGALTRYPDSILLRDLKAQGEAGQRQNAAEFLEQVANRLANESDLPTRGNILEEALRQYPNEAYFADELVLVRNRQRLIEDVANRALELEKEGYLSEALEQWTYLKGLYPTHQGAEPAIARCNQLIRVNRETTRGKLLAAVENAISNRDYPSAAERLLDLRAEFPEDPSVANLEQLIAERRELRARSLDLLEQGGQSFKRRDFQLGTQQLHQALEATQNEPDVAGAIAATLVQHASMALDKHLSIAESMLALAKVADPALVFPKELRDALLEAHYKLDLEQFQSAVEPLESSENFTEAAQLTRNFLAKYPGDAAAEAIQSRLAKAQATAIRRQQREQNLSQLRSFEDQARTVTRVADLLDLRKQADLIGRQNNSDSEVTRIAGQVSNALAVLAKLRGLIEESQLNEARQTCDKAIAEFSENAVFQQLRAEIELRQNESASAYLRQVERDLAAQPDFEKQARILETAIREYPNESYFTDELALLKNRRSLLEAEISRARDLESKELYEDALREWESLQRSYRWLPGIESEIERVRQIWQQRTTAIRNAWLGKINRALALADVDSAESVLEEARLELAGDPVLADIDAQIERAKQARLQRQEAELQGRAALEHSDFLNAARLLALAANSFKEDLSYRQYICGLLLKQAASAIQSDWQGSDTLLSEIARIDARFPIPTNLREAVERQRREQDIVLLLDKAGSAEAADNLKEAKRLLDSGFKTFPEEARISQRRTAIIERMRQVVLQEGREQARLQTEQARSKLLASSSSKRQLSKLKADYLSKGLADSADPEIKDHAALFIAEIDSKIDALQLRHPPRSGLIRFWYVPLFLVVAGAFLFLWLRQKPTQNGVPSPKAEQATRTLLPTPATPVIQISGNVETGDVLLDGNKIGALQAGSLDLRQLSPGPHVLGVNSPQGHASISVINDAAQGPRVSAPIKADRVSVIAVSTNSQSAVITTSRLDGQPVTIDDKDAGSTLDSSLLLHGLQPGNHHFQVGSSKKNSPFDLAVQSQPSILLLITGEALTGRLTVKTNVPGANLLLDGKPYATDGERSLSLILPVKTYSIYATHDGYSPSDPAHVEVAKGTLATVTLHLTPKPAKLEIPTLVAGTQIKLDGKPLDNPRSSQGASISMAAGAHVIEIARQGFSPRRLERSVEPGQTLSLNKADLDLSSAAAVPDPMAHEAEEWKALKNSNSLSDLQSFQRRYVQGPHAQAVNERIQEVEWVGLDRTSGAALSAYLTKYPQSSHAGEARQLSDQIARGEKSRLDQSEWDSLDKTNKDALQSFLAKNPGGNHTNAARQLLADIGKAEKSKEDQGIEESAWNAVDKRQRSSLEAYVSRFPSGKHSSQAQQALAGLATAQNTQSTSPDDSASVLAVLQKFAAAWEAKNVATISELQPSLTQRSLRSLLEPVRKWQTSITPLSPPRVNGDLATVQCRRLVSQTFADGTEKQAGTTVTYTLRRQGSGWIIEQVR